MLVLLTVLGILGSLLLPPVGPPPPLTDKTLDFSDWVLEPELAEDNVVDADLAGAWTDRTQFTKLRFTPLAEGGFKVSFLSRARCGLGGCVKLERTATYHNGVVLLDRPVQELLGERYQRLYTLLVDQDLYLVPSIRVADVLESGTVPYRGVLRASWP
jgi:hypothetical protein